jgi:hypothetical protein
MKKLVGFAALFTAGLLLAGGLTAVGVADITTTTETQAVTTTVEQTTTAPAETVVSTLQQTTTQKIRVPAKTTATTSETSSSNSTPTWVWIVLAILAAAVIGLIVALATRRGGISGEERQRRLEAAVASWAAQGWAVENQSPGSAILRRGPEVMVVSVDAQGQVSTRPAAS